MEHTILNSNFRATLLKLEFTERDIREQFRDEHRIVFGEKWRAVNFLDGLTDDDIVVKCDLCESAAAGTIKYLTNQGWVWAALTHPQRIMTRCPDHRNTLQAAVNKVLSDESDRLFNIFQIERNRPG